MVIVCTADGGALFATVWQGGEGSITHHPGFIPIHCGSLRDGGDIQQTLVQPESRHFSQWREATGPLSLFESRSPSDKELNAGISPGNSLTVLLEGVNV